MAWDGLLQKIFLAFANFQFNSHFFPFFMSEDYQKLWGFFSISIFYLIILWSHYFEWYSKVFLVPENNLLQMIVLFLTSEEKGNSRQAADRKSFDIIRLHSKSWLTFIRAVIAIQAPENQLNLNW